MAFRHDIIVIPLSLAVGAATTPVPRHGFPVVRGEAGGNTHLLLADGTVFYDPRQDGQDGQTLGTLTVADGAVAGNIGCWTQDGLRLVGYWIGRDFWGRGVATTALAELAAEIPERPLHAWVAATNVGSIRVLEKCGFVEVERHAEYNQHAGRAVEEILYRLD